MHSPSEVVSYFGTTKMLEGNVIVFYGWKQQQGVQQRDAWNKMAARRNDEALLVSDFWGH